MLTGQNGILNRAAEAKEKTKKAQAVENEKVNEYGQEIEDVLSNISQVNDAEPGKLEEINGEYIINSIEDLVVFSAETISGENNYDGKTVKLGQSLDFKSKKSYANPDRTDYNTYGYDGKLIEMLNNTGFNGIGTFSGTFDGNGYIIKNLIIKKEITEYSYLGFININQGIIRNLNIENCNMEVRGIANYVFLGGICGNNSGKIYNCKVTGTIKSYYHDSILGGIAGRSENEIKNCINYAEISGKSIQCGGIVGQHTEGSIRQCGNYGNINLDYAQYVGGVIGLSLMIDNIRDKCGRMFCKMRYNCKFRKEL